MHLFSLDCIRAIFRIDLWKLAAADALPEVRILESGRQEVLREVPSCARPDLPHLLVRNPPGFDSCGQCAGALHGDTGITKGTASGKPRATVSAPVQLRRLARLVAGTRAKWDNAIGQQAADHQKDRQCEPRECRDCTRRRGHRTEDCSGRDLPVRGSHTPIFGPRLARQSGSGRCRG